MMVATLAIIVSHTPLAIASIGDDVAQEVAPPAHMLPAPASAITEPAFMIAFADGTTNEIVRRLRQAESECGQVPAEYRADCLQQGYRSAAGPASGKADYSTAQTELNSVSRSIGGLVSQNADTAAQPLRKGGKTYRAVKKNAVATVNSRAAAIITEAETKLLRSASSGLRKTHYTRIAQAVGSTKKILRS